MDFSVFFQGIFAIVFFTNFVRLFTVLTILRVGLGFLGGGMGLVMGVISLAFAVVSVELPGSEVTIKDMFKEGINFEQSFRGNVQKLADPEITKQIVLIKEKKILQLSGKDSIRPLDNPVKSSSEERPVDVSFSVLVASSIFSQLIEAFQSGARLLIPFLVIDLLLGSILSALGVTVASLEVVSAPIKIIFFVTVGGWEMILKLVL